MKLLLTTLNSKYIHSNLAVRYLYQAAKTFHGQLERKEYTINNDENSIFVELVRGQYDLVAFSCYIWNIRPILYLAENLKKACPDVSILLGGPEVSFQVQELMQDNPAVDFVLTGEGEISFPLFLQSFSREMNRKNMDCGKEIREEGEQGTEKAGYENVAGLFWRRDGTVTAAAGSKPVDFASVPFVYEGQGCEKDRVIYYESSRGCPYGCAYCLSCLQKGMRPLPVSRVKEDLTHFLRQQVKQVKLIDRTFNYDRERTMDLVGFLIERDNGITNFHFELCGDLVTDEFIELVSQARDGLFQFEVGVQSTNPQTLSACNRTSHIPELGQRIRRMRSLGNVHLHLDLIAGLPFEDYQSFGRSFDEVYAMKPHELQLGFLKLLKGTPMREKAQDYAMSWRSQAPYEVISTRWMDAAEMVKLKQVEAMLELYGNRGGFSQTIDFVLEALYSSPFLFFTELGEFYYERGYQDRAHKKEDLYRIFYEFALDRGSEVRWDPVRIRELLTGDMKATLNFDAVKKFEKKGWKLTL